MHTITRSLADFFHKLWLSMMEGCGLSSQLNRSAVFGPLLHFPLWYQTLRAQAELSATLLLALALPKLHTLLH